MLNNPTISRRHAELDIYRDGRLRLRDLESKVGTFVRRGDKTELAAEVFVGPDDEILFAAVEMTVEDCLARAGQKKYALAHAAMQSSHRTLSFDPHSGSEMVS